MSWAQPSDYEQALYAHARAVEALSPLLPLAGLLCLPPRIEPLLLRNARLRFLPSSDATLEARFWFSPLIAARGNHEVLLHAGLARLLANDLPRTPTTGAVPTLDQIWAFTRRHTRHWSAEDRLERDLRYHRLVGDGDAQHAGLKTILNDIMREPAEAGRIELARLAKRALPLVAAPPPEDPRYAPYSALAQYAALALGDAGAWIQPGPPRALPPSLSARLPAPLGDDAVLTCELRPETTGATGRCCT